MPSRKYSPMEPAQRQALERERSKRFYKPLFQIRKPGDAVGVFFMLAGCAALGWLAGVVILLLFYLLSLVLPDASAPDALTRPASVQLTMIASAALGMLGIPLWLHDRRRRAAHGRAGELEADLADGRVEVVTVQATGAARCEPMEHEGEEPKAFFLQVGASEVLFLQGGYLDKALRAGTFPNSEFDVIRGAKSGMALEIRCHGKPLPLIAHDYSDITEEECRFPSDGEVLAATLETIPASLRQSKKS